MNALRPAIGLALLRVTVGFVFAMHGYQKFFMYGLDGVTGGFTQMGVPMANIAAPLVATVELVGGLLVISGSTTASPRWGTSAWPRERSSSRSQAADSLRLRDLSLNSRLASRR